MSARWFRDIYRDAVWESPNLKAAEKAVAETFARHARNLDGDKGPDADLSWLTYPRLMEKAGIGRRAAVSAALAMLVEHGWLVVVREVPRRPTVYRLTVPSSDVGTTEDLEDGSSTVGTTNAVRPNAASSSVGTTVVPSPDAGSSDVGTTVVPPASLGSSDGGTQPLGPLISSSSPSSGNARPGALTGADDDDDEEIEKQATPTPHTWTAAQRSALNMIVDKTGANPDEAEAMAQLILTERPGTSLFAFAARATASGLQGWLNRVRSTHELTKTDTPATESRARLRLVTIANDTETAA